MGKSRFNLESSVEHREGCFGGGAGQGITTRNSCSIASSYNAAMRRHRCAIFGVAMFTRRVNVSHVKNTRYFKSLRLVHSGQLRIPGSSFGRT